MKSDIEKTLESAISRARGEAFHLRSSTTVGGGCINDAILLEGDSGRFFVKLNTAASLNMFKAETEALEAIIRTRTIRAPHPITCGSVSDHAYLVLEALDFGSGGASGHQKMGQQLANLHRHTAAQFGWHRSNFIGGTPQSNRHHPRWADFFQEERLRPQFEMAAGKGMRFKGSEDLLNQVERLLGDHHPEPSLLHGDLWSGNAAFLSNGSPVLFDPGSYYGDRETDLAFSEFFGGFPRQFYEAYNDTWPISLGYASRKQLYNLYHVLNHANLFGGHYVCQAQQIIHRILQS